MEKLEVHAEALARYARCLKVLYTNNGRVPMDQIGKEIKLQLEKLSESDKNAIALFWRTWDELSKTHNVKMGPPMLNCNGNLFAFSQADETFSYDTVFLESTPTAFLHGISLRLDDVLLKHKRELLEKEYPNASGCISNKSLDAKKIQKLAKSIAQALFSARIEIY